MSKLRIGVASVVTVVWGIGYLVSYLNTEVDVPPEVTPVMLAVVGWLFAAEIRARGRGMDD